MAIGPAAFCGLKKTLPARPAWNRPSPIWLDTLTTSRRRKSARARIARRLWCGRSVERGTTTACMSPEGTGRRPRLRQRRAARGENCRTHDAHLLREWVLVESPVGELGVGLGDGAVSGVSFGRPKGVAVGDDGADRWQRELLSQVSGELAEYFAGRRATFDVAYAVRPRQRFRAGGMGGDRRDPVRRDDQLRCDRPGGRRARWRPGGRAGLQPQPGSDHRAVPPGDRLGREAGRLRRRAGAQAFPADPGGPGAHRAHLGSIESRKEGHLVPDP